MKDKSLYSEEFDDLYSSKQGALQECEYVFLKGNNLEERFRELKYINFHIGEIGFGIGLNFLSICKAWLEKTQNNQILEFTSFDKYLFKLKDFKKQIQLMPELMNYGLEFEKFYPHNILGTQRISLFEGRVLLNLVIGDIAVTKEYLSSLKQVDAWFLDGFSPAKNPDLWTRDLFDAISETCTSDSTFATYTSSGSVKKNLIDSGFAVEKVKGFSNKRHMLRGKSRSKKIYIPSNEKKVAIIGAGITGCTLAYVLSKRGMKVDLFEKSESICTGASSHNLLVTYPRLSAHDTPFGRFSIQSYLYAINFYENLKTKAWKKTGVLMLSHDEASKKREESLLKKRSDGKIYQYVSAKKASEISGISMRYDGLYFKDAGYILPRDMCEFLVDVPNVDISVSSVVENISKENGKFNLTINDNTFEYSDVCLCTGSETNKLINLEGFNIKRGQVTHIKSENSISNVKVPICAKGYISPEINGIHVVGSSYSNLIHTEIEDVEHASNLENLKIIYDEDVFVDSGKVGIRAVSKDHVPIVGKYNDLYINTCHGSKASVTSPISAEIIASTIVNGSLPLDKRELDSLSPERFN